MASISSAPSQPSSKEIQAQYQIVLDALLAKPHVWYSPPNSPHALLIPQKSNAGIPTISSLSIHPVIEALLHLWNSDLPSAHFLVRHMEVSPKWESMFVHGVLHRIEGDIDNTRCWYRDVHEKEAFVQIWGTTDDGKEVDESAPSGARKGYKNFLDRIERFRDRTRTKKGVGGWEQDQDKLKVVDVKDWKQEEEELREISLWEMRALQRICENKFGVGRVENAKTEFLGRIESGNEEHAKVAQSMVTGGEGWRTF